MKKITVSISQVGNHFEIAAFCGGDFVESSEWSFNWKDAKKSAKDLATKVNASQIVRTIAGMTFEVK